MSKFHVILVAIFLGCVAAVHTGCTTSTTTTRSSVNVELVGTNTIRYSGELVPLAQFPKRLKKAGYPIGQTVRLQVGEQTTSATMHSVKQTIQKGGFPVIMHRPSRTYAGPPVKSGRTGGKSQTLDKQRVLSAGSK